MSSHQAVQPAETINAMIADTTQRNAARPALVAKDGGKAWQPLTYAELGVRLRAFSLGLRSLGVNPGDRVAILSENRPEWAVADLATLAMGGVTVPIYPTLPSPQVAYLLADSGARAVVVSDAKQLRKVIESREFNPELTIFVAMEAVDVKNIGDINLISFEQVLRMGEAADAANSLQPGFETLRDSVAPGDLASLIYTSGTTGNQKGAMLTHANLRAAVRGANEGLPFQPEGDVFLSFLPLCHVFERVTYYLALHLGDTTYYAESIFKVRDNMVEVKPTLMQSVPRLYESIYDAVMQNVGKAPERQKKIALWAIETGVQYARRTNAGKFVSPLLAFQHAAAEKLALGKLRERLGGRWRLFVSGGAPLPSATAEFFQGIGIPMVEGYGLTETTACAVLNPMDRAKTGTVGKVLPGVKMKLAPDGEILISGPTVMKGYWNNAEATAEAIDAQGWFHTGDIGEIDSQGYVRITDRKKDIIVLANGKKVAPQPIENLLKSAPLISEVILLGDKAGTISAIVIPDFEHLRAWAKDFGKQFDENAALAADPDARAAIKKQIDERSAALADFEKIRRIALLDHALSIESGELTPTLKVRRKIVQERYGHLLD